MNFAERLQYWGDKTAVITPKGEPVSYSALANLTDECAKQLGNKHSICLIRCRNQLSSLIAYLACLRHRRVALLVDDKLSDAQSEALIERFKITAVVAGNGTVSHHFRPGTICRGDLALLLSTSGSTGSSKLVMLSADNLEANAESICAYLPITENDIAIAHLPLHYSYGLSVVNTHLSVGATLSLTDASLVSREFWQQCRRDRITSFSGVPQHYQMLRQLRFERMDLPHLRYLTQAGGRLEPEQVRYFAELAHSKGQKFFVMYGQTEATARMAYLAPEQAVDHPECIGQAIPNGRLWLQAPDGSIVTHPHTMGELFYQGPNVMLGYAEQARDLSSNSKLDKLATGDLAYFNETGLFKIVGRLNRYLKIYGRRINLDELEQQLARQGWPVLCAGSDDRLRLACLPETPVVAVKQYLFQHYQFHPAHVEVALIEAPPLTASGKVDYPQLSALAYD